MGGRERPRNRRRRNRRDWRWRIERGGEEGIDRKTRMERCKARMKEEGKRCVMGERRRTAEGEERRGE